MVAPKANTGKTKVANTLKSFYDQEANRETWGRIYSMDGTVRLGKGLSMVVAPNDEGEWTERITREGIEEAKLLENE